MKLKWKDGSALKSASKLKFSVSSQLISIKCFQSRSQLAPTWPMMPTIRLLILDHVPPQHKSKDIGTSWLVAPLLAFTISIQSSTPTNPPISNFMLRILNMPILGQLWDWKQHYSNLIIVLLRIIPFGLTLIHMKSKDSSRILRWILISSPYK